MSLSRKIRRGITKKLVRENPMQLEITNRDLLVLDAGLQELLSVDDLESLFTLRASRILETIQADVRGYNRARRVLERRYGTIDIKEDGEVVGKRASDEDDAEYQEKLDELLGKEVSYEVPVLKFSEIQEMREKEDVDIPSSVIYKIRLVTMIDVTVGEDFENDDQKRPPQTRAERAVAKKAEAAEADG